MARRSRRRRNSPSRANPRSFSELRGRSEREEEGPSSEAGEEKAEPPASGQPAEEASVLKGEGDWKVEYGRVFSDLRQLLIVSAALFAVMLLVGFFL